MTDSSVTTSLLPLVSLHSSHIRSPSVVVVSVRTLNRSPQVLDGIATDSGMMKDTVWVEPVVHRIHPEDNLHFHPFRPG